MTQDRRTFLATLGAAALAATARNAFAETADRSPERLSRLGIQLYTVRRLAAADLGGTIAQVAKIGYKEVELAGFYGHTAVEIRDLLMAHGLTAPSAHIAIEQIERDPVKTFADAATIGLQWITVPSLPRGAHVTADDWKRVAEQFNRAATRAKNAGFRFAFHNHNDIVREVNGVLPIDILMRDTEPGLVSFEMDIYWAVSGGADPVALLARFPGRFHMLHVKDGVPPYTDASQTDVGQGTIDFRTILGKASGIEHWFVESDSAKDPLAFAAAAYTYLTNMKL
jgi:sugar phosphate isomerase/epimerase